MDFPDLDQDGGNQDVTFDSLENGPDLFTDEEPSGEGDLSHDAGSQGEEKAQGDEVAEKQAVEPAEKAAEEKVEEEDLVVKQVGKDTFLRVKGKDYPLTDFTPEDLRTLLQKGLRSDQLMREAADLRKTAETERSQVLSQLEQARTLFGELQRSGPQAKPTRPTGALPAELEDADYDSPDVRAVKSLSRDLYNRVQALEHRDAAARYERGEAALLSEINQLSETYPLASKEEVIAVKAFYPNVPIDQLMAKSHEYYASEQYVERVFKHKPELAKTYAERAVSNYLAKKGQGNRGIVGRPAGSGEVRASSAGKIKPEDMTFDKAAAMARAHIERMIKSVEEEG